MEKYKVIIVEDLINNGEDTLFLNHNSNELKYISTLAVDTGYYDDAIPSPVIYIHNVVRDNTESIMDILFIATSLNTVRLNTDVSKLNNKKDILNYIDNNIAPVTLFERYSLKSFKEISKDSSLATFDDFTIEIVDTRENFYNNDFKADNEYDILKIELPDSHEFNFQNVITECNQHNINYLNMKVLVNKFNIVSGQLYLCSKDSDLSIDEMFDIVSICERYAIERETIEQIREDYELLESITVTKENIYVPEEYNEEVMTITITKVTVRFGDTVYNYHFI